MVPKKGKNSSIEYKKKNKKKSEKNEFLEEAQPPCGGPLAKDRGYGGSVMRI